MRTLLALLAVFALAGCAAPHRLKDTQTIHDAAATRVWLIHETDGNASVVMCDTEMLKQTRNLCFTSRQLWSIRPALPPPNAARIVAGWLYKHVPSASARSVATRPPARTAASRKA